MTLEQAEQYRLKMRTAGHTSDGCTFAPEMGTPCCETHDYLRRYLPEGITPAEADVLFRKCLQSKGYRVMAWVYYMLVVLGRKLRIFR